MVIFHTIYGEVEELEKDTLDQIIARSYLECEIDKILRKYTSASGGEQSAMMIEKYERKTIDDDER